MEIKNKRLLTVVLAVLMISLFTVLYFAISANFVSAAPGDPPEIVLNQYSKTLTYGETWSMPLVATETSMALSPPSSFPTSTSMPSLTATSTNLTKWTLVGAPGGVSIIGAGGDTLYVNGTVAVGTHTFWIIATNSVGHDVREFTLTINSSGGSSSPGGSSSDSSGSGGGTGTAYNVKVKAGEGGTASANMIAAVAGAKVTITVKPAKGYVVKSVVVNEDKKDALVPVSKDSETKYSFIMPAGDVTVTVTFEEAEEPEGGEEPDGEPGDEHICPSLPYVDVDQSLWYHEYVDFVIATGIMTGTSTDPLMFEPNTKLSRAMMVQILYNIEGRPAVDSGEIFGDVPPGSWFFDAVAWSYTNEIVFGYDNGNFGPNDPVTREQMVAILYRYAQSKGYDVSASADLSSFADAGEISDWAVPAMKWAVASGLIVGRDATHIVPKDNATRAEVATIITRAYKIILSGVPTAPAGDDAEEDADDSEIEDETEEAGDDEADDEAPVG